MPAPSDLRALRLLAIAALPALLIGGSCAKKAAHSESPQDARYADAPPGAGDPLAELDALEQQMRELGLPTAADKAAADGAGAEQAGGDVNLGAAEEAGERESPDAFEEDATIDEAPAEPAPEAATATEGSRRDRKRSQEQACAPVCNLSEAICELEGRICSMSSEHGEDPTYTAACERASEDCELAADECSACMRG